MDSLPGDVTEILVKKLEGSLAIRQQYHRGKAILRGLLVLSGTQLTYLWSGWHNDVLTRLGYILE